MVSLLFSCVSDRYIGVEPPYFIFELVLDGMSVIVLVLSLYLLCGCVSFNLKSCPYIHRSKVIVLVSLDMVPVPLNQGSLELGINI